MEVVGAGGRQVGLTLAINATIPLLKFFFKRKA